MKAKNAQTCLRGLGGRLNDPSFAQVSVQKNCQGTCPTEAAVEVLVVVGAFRAERSP